MYRNRVVVLSIDIFIQADELAPALDQSLAQKRRSAFRPKSAGPKSPVGLMFLIFFFVFPDFDSRLIKFLV